MKYHRTILLFWGLFFTFPFFLQAQEVLDNTAFYRAKYLFLYKKDSTRTTFYQDEFYLDICKSGHSFFYSRANQFKDSVENALKLDGISGMDLIYRTKSIKTGLQWYIDKRFIDGEFDYTNKLHDYKRYTAPLQLPSWEIVGDTITINGFHCKEAHATIGGRKWIAWYTEDVQIIDGPWLLWGLPGLIVHAKDSNNYFKFSCVSVEYLDEPYSVILPGDNNVVHEVSQKMMLQQEELKETNPMAFMQTLEGVVKVVVSDKVRKKEYIPIIILDKSE